DLGEEARAEEQERLGRLAEREAPALGLDPVLATERRGLLEMLVPAGAVDPVEVADEEIAHPHPALPEPAKRSLVEARVPILGREIRTHALQEFRRDPVR